MYFVRLRPVQSLQRGQWPNWKSPLMTWKVWKSQTQASSCGHCHLAACFCIAWLRLNCLSRGSSWLLKHKINKRPQVWLLLQQILLNKPLEFGHYHLVVPKIYIILFLFPRQGCIIVHGEHGLLILNLYKLKKNPMGFKPCIPYSRSNLFTACRQLPLLDTSEIAVWPFRVWSSLWTMTSF